MSRLPAYESLWYFCVYQCFYPALINTLIRRWLFFFTVLFVIVREGGCCSPDLFIISSSFLFIERYFNGMSFDILRFSYLEPPHGILYFANRDTFITLYINYKCIMQFDTSISTLEIAIDERICFIMLIKFVLYMFNIGRIILKFLQNFNIKLNLGLK